MRLLSLLLLSGCLIEDKVEQPDFACAGAELPVRAPEFVNVRGFVRDLGGTTPVASVNITGSASGIDLPIVRTDSNGFFEFAHETPGTPTRDSVLAEVPGFLPVRTYPGIPIFGDSEFEVRMVDLQTVTDFAGTGGIDPTAGAIALVRVTDCNEAPVAGGEIRTQQNNPITYFNLSEPDASATRTDASGLAIISEMAPGMVTISGTVGDVVLRDNEIEVTGREFIETLARP